MEIESVSNPPEHCLKTGKRGGDSKTGARSKTRALKNAGISSMLYFVPAAITLMLQSGMIYI